MTSIDADQKHTHQIGDAFRKVHDLVNIPLSEDVPIIQAANFSVLYQSAFAGSYEDAMVYAELQDLYNQGQEYAIMLYTWRSISRALPHSSNQFCHSPNGLNLSTSNEYTSLTADLAWHTNIAVTRTSERSVAENRELYDLALRGLQCLSSWSVQVLDTFTWKLAHCADEHTNRECPKDAENYERGTRYNYTSEERCALIRLITMIKSVQTQLLRLETNYSEAIRRSAVVDAVEADLLMTGSSNSVGKSGWGGRSVSAKASAQNSLTSGSNSTLAKAAESMVGTPIRRVGPSSTQLYLVRTMLELMIDQASPAAKYHSLRKELDSNTMAAIETFLKNSFYWPYLLNFSGEMETLVKCCDLSQLWYREFFLEIANGKRIQFPIEMSLPWILTDHILETRDPALMESLLYPLDLYNDAADCALNRFHRRFFFDEIEAEANLVFDQLVYKLSDQLFRYYKQYAASILLDKKFRLEAQRAGWREPYPQPNRYAAALIRQRSVQLLGRSIDLSYLLSQRINRAIAKSLEEAIQRFLCSDITAVVELEALIECNRLCHRMLAEHLELDDFDGMLQEANNLVTSPLSKIAFHVFWEVTWDLVKNYCYNGSTNRFVQTKFALAETLEREKPSLCAPEYLWGSKSLNSCYEAIFQLSRGFIGAPHFSAICRLLGYQGIFIIFTEIMKFCKSLVNQTIKEYVRRIASMMPKSVSLPSPTANSDSQYGLYANALQRVYQYSDLRTNVCQNFREFGNIIIFCLQMEKRLTTEDLGDLKHADAFIRKPASSTGERPISDPKMRDSSNQIDGLNIYKVASAVGSSELAELADGNEVLTRERLCCGLVLFEQLLNRIREFLNEEEPQTGAANGTARQMPRNVWYGSEASGTTADTDELIEIEGCTQFHRVWSAIQFVFSTPFGENEYTVEEMFGEGLNWAGCTLITLLGQQRRFEMLDFGAHFVKLQRSDKLDTCKDGVSGRSSERAPLSAATVATYLLREWVDVRVRLHGKTAAFSPFPSSTLVLLIPPPIPMCTRMLRVIAVVPSLAKIKIGYYKRARLGGRLGDSCSGSVRQHGGIHMRTHRTSLVTHAVYRCRDRVEKVVGWGLI
ncbi:Cytoplasmic FMR1-interacting protein [Echinococcus granulosus]|uniref:Cytoplasmic FMR1-interacting protein n=1 Tax=Echinococcus granulosus TaxID=6210 RepID=W6UYK5_ECHGR|nr:Cytoplasmic FMR1-interacting protein [Echinococcus granulosus]EUB63727.1 Cytoplasmic FMR1-interacting protein [Echinococcus granulosus]